MKKELLERIISGKKNVIISGNVATGKTTNVMFPMVDEIIDAKENIFIIDAKEEYINKYYDKLKEKNYNIVVINLRDLSKSEGWNPLEYPYSLYKKGNIDATLDYLEEMAQIIFYKKEDYDPYWANTASDFFVGVTLALFEDGASDEINFNSINAIFNGVDKHIGRTDYTTEYLKSKGINSQAYIYSASTIMAPRDTKASILSVATQRIKPFVSREKLTHMINKTTFSLDNVDTTPTAIFFIARDENKSLNNLATIFIEQLYSKLISMKIKNKFNLILDNFDVIERFNGLTDMLESSTSRNVKFYILTRLLDEFKETYGNAIIKLCNTVSINNSEVSLMIDDKNININNEFVEVLIPDANFEYPKLDESSVNVFSIPEKNQASHINVEDIMKKIDKKIEELEKED